jgi:hypothetical protein
MILVMHYPLEDTRTPNSCCYWVAEAEIAGRVFSARSRHGAPNALFRKLVEAAIADSPAQVTIAGLRGAIRYPSFHVAAQVTYTEGAGRSIARVRYREFRPANEGEQAYPTNDEPAPAECPETVYGEGKDRGKPAWDGSLEAERRVTPKSGAGDKDDKRRACAMCGRLFRPWRPQAVHCSGGCRQKAYRKRSKTPEAGGGACPQFSPEELAGRVDMLTSFCPSPLPPTAVREGRALRAGSSG